MKTLTIFAAAVFLLSAGYVAAATIYLADVADTTLYKTYTADLGNNAQNQVFVTKATKNRRSLVKFEDLPDGIPQVNTAYMEVELQYATVGTQVQVKRMTQSWVEGNGTINSGANWNTYDGMNVWVGGAGADNDAIDDGDPFYEPPDVAYGSTMNVIARINVTKITQAWAAGAANYGIMVKISATGEADTSGEYSSSFWSKDSDQTVPRLVVNDPLYPPTPKPGDADEDGDVDATDAVILASNWMVNSVDIRWANGDFNDDDVVNEIDATLMATNWTGARGVTVPEPGMLTLLVAGTALLMLLRCKNRAIRQ